MCLYTKQICPQRARRDIVCCKVFCKSVDSLYIVTPYQRTYILKPTENNPTLMDDTNVDKIENTTTTYHNNETGKFRRIGRGMIHAYVYPGAIYIDGPRNLLYKCIIPKGTLYYKGTNGDICAKKMLIVEQMICGSQAK